MIILLVCAGIVVVLGFTVFFGAPYVPSHKAELERAFRIQRPLTKHDVLVDLGCGDGVVLRMAVSAGARKAVGVELNPVLGVVAKILTYQNKNIDVHLGNMWTSHLAKDTTVVYVFGVGRDMKKLEGLLESWSIDRGKPIDLILYGHTLPNRKPERTVGAHHLYHF